MDTLTNSMSVRKVLITGKILRRRSSGTSAPLPVSGRAADGRGTDTPSAPPTLTLVRDTDTTDTTVPRGFAA